MNIGLLIRGAKAGAKLAGRAAKATGRGAKAGAKAAGRGAKGAAKATGAKAKGAAKAVGKTKVAKGAKRVGGKVVEGVGYASTPGLRKSGGRYFKKKGTGAIKSVSKASVKKTGKKVVGGAAAVGTGYGTTKTVKSKKASASAAKAKRDAAAAKARTETSKAKTPKANPVKKAKPGAPKKALPAYAKLGSNRKGNSRFDAMSKSKLKSLTGKNKLMYRRYLREGGKNKIS